jgi:ABC-2 type transport system permease protein
MSATASTNATPTAGAARATKTATSSTNTAPTPTRIVPGVDRIVHNNVGVVNTARHTFTMAHRTLLKMRRTPEQLFDVTIQPIVFTLMLTYIFGGAISGDVQSYLPFFIPGILVQTVVTTSVVTGVQLREDMDKGVFDRFRSLPMARVAPLAGALLGDTVRYAIATTLTLIMGIIMGWRPGGGVLGVVLTGLVVIAMAWSISWIFAFFGVIGRSASGVQGVSFLILFPLTFLSNIFVPVATMPGWLRAFANANPVSHVATVARELSNTGHSGVELLWSLAGAVVIVLVFGPLTVRAYMKRS